MGRAFVEVLVQNYDDVALRETGRGRGHRIRKEKVKALADAGSAMLGLHKATIENLDLVVDPKTNQVIPNPESGGRYTLDLLPLHAASSAP